MDPTTVVEKAYKLIYLVDVPEAIPGAEIILADDWKKYMKEILYGIAFMAIKSKAYKTKILFFIFINIIQPFP